MRSYPSTRVRCSDQERQAATAQERRTAERSYHMPVGGSGSREEQPQFQGAAAAGCRRAERNYSTFKVRRDGCEKIPLCQGKEQRLRFAGAAVKRYPTSKVRETQVRW